jgi:nucleotide-binding universal stress UspA family protein
MLVAALAGMSSHHPVVVGFDFGHCGEAALDRAVQLAARVPAHVLHVVCVIDPKHAIPAIPPNGEIDYLYAAQVQEVLASVMHAALERNKVSANVRFFVHARMGGKPAEVILNLAREVGAELIIVGSHGLTGIERLVLGSTSERIVREAHCTVEVARPNTYEEVDMMSVVEVPGHDHTYVPPHRYEYEDHRVILRPADWALW